MKPKQLATNVAPIKASSNSRTHDGKSVVAKLPHAARSLAPEKVRAIKAGQKRDASALFQVLAASIPSTLSEEAMEAFADSLEALYLDFRATDAVELDPC